MARVRVITDSACDLSALASEHDITIVPLSIRFGTEEFIDGGPGHRRVLGALRGQRRAPRDRRPVPRGLPEGLPPAAEDGYDGVVCINLSAELSGTHQSAGRGRGRGRPIDVRVVDTRSVTMGLA